MTNQLSSQALKLYQALLFQVRLTCPFSDKRGRLCFLIHLAFKRYVRRLQQERDFILITLSSRSINFDQGFDSTYMDDFFSYQNQCLKTGDTGRSPTQSLVAVG